MSRYTRFMVDYLQNRCKAGGFIELPRDVLQVSVLETYADQASGNGAWNFRLTMG